VTHTAERVHVIGTGLIGASLGIALSRRGTTVTLEDQSPTAAALAGDLGAGRLPAVGEELAPELVVVATPPDVAADVVDRAVARWPEAVVTDVASVKGAVREGLVTRGTRLAHYVGSHPMAGRERSGAVAARGDLFEGRAWVISPGPETDPRAVDLVRGVAATVGAAVMVLSAEEHDAAVAAVSHVPQVAASLVAARLEELPDSAVALAGQGVRDVTRIAASDPQLWTQILAGNAAAVAAVLRGLVDDLTEVLTALERLGADSADAPGTLGVLARAIAAGNAGHERIPGKHGAAPTAYRTVVVLVPDRPGELGRLFHDVGDAGVNLEDLHLEHGLGQPFGLAEISVLPAVASHLEAELTSRGWRLHS
jgi:prephenate dehydrogenase